jgi:dTDP-4-amino-4,6-dideoxy-D-galactose acyltransferase
MKKKIESRGIIKRLAWDSGFFNMEVARMNGSMLTRRGAQSALGACKKMSIECLYAVLDATQSNIEIAHSNGFLLMGTRVTYELNVHARAYLQKERDQRAECREASESDERALLALSGALSRESRFYLDKRFGPASAQRLYEAWVKKLLMDTRPSTKVFVVTVRGEVAGYIGASAKGTVVHIELVVTAPQFRRRALGRFLMSKCLGAYQKDGYNRFRVVTQGSNIPAQRLYQSCGFRVIAAHLDYHKWFT